MKESQGLGIRKILLVGFPGVTIETWGTRAPVSLQTGERAALWVR
jgi:hypothetical protein